MQKVLSRNSKDLLVVAKRKCSKVGHKISTLHADATQIGITLKTGVAWLGLLANCW